ncbi:hypothetical protein DSCO28_17560 [Desulfosarcina ovata subsp. sediminis]|uniref:Uncharacterized protein n=1 Tax=Desulfosarcina ovata subsp. sediminis TaxID=885957 RepID=A0A5K7ZPW1_9BACT|nr:hypothetical protein [Desulfosarcina ovata]BBO81190.1 hypothetical protein DSCO28_17560 [Desulfosarcina ovata subsp. sediminis]
MATDEITETRQRLRQLSSLSKQSWIDKKLRADLHEMRFRKAIKLALLMLQRRLESGVDGPFDPVISRKLDAISVLLND